MPAESFPTGADRQIITCTGHANSIQAAGGKAKTIILQARATSAGGTHTANGDLVFIGVGSAPGTTTEMNGFYLGPGEQMTLALDDTSALYFQGANGDQVFITALV